MGNVGIGMTSPGFKLQTYDATNSAIAATDSTTPVTTKIQSTDSAGWVGTHTNHPLYFFINNSATPMMAINTAGNVGIGTTSPQAKLHISGTSGTDGIRFPDGTMQLSGFTPSTHTGEESVTFPNGLIMKFGNTTVSVSDTIVTFASAFPHACVTVVACGGNPTDTLWDYALYTSNLSVSSFKLRVRIPARQTPIRWIAIGY